LDKISLPSEEEEDKSIGTEEVLNIDDESFDLPSKKKGPKKLKPRNGQKKINY